MKFASINSYMQSQQLDNERGDFDTQRSRNDSSMERHKPVDTTGKTAKIDIRGRKQQYRSNPWAAEGAPPAEEQR